MKPRIAIITVLVISILTIYSIYSYVSSFVKTSFSSQNIVKDSGNNDEPMTEELEEDSLDNDYGKNVQVNVPSDSVPIKKEIDLNLQPQEPMQNPDENGEEESLFQSDEATSSDTESSGFGIVKDKPNEQKSNPPSNETNQPSGLNTPYSNINQSQQAPVSNPSSKPEGSANLSKGLYRVVINASTADIADAIAESIKTSNLLADPVIQQNGGKYRVQVGAFSAKNRAYELIKKLQDNDYTAYMVVY